MTASPISLVNALARVLVLAKIILLLALAVALQKLTSSK
jgi:hypothetical protein